MNNAAKSLLVALSLVMLFFTAPANALETQVLSNFNQPSSGAVWRLGVSDLIAVPFTTDATFTEFDGVDLTAVTLFGSGLFFVQIYEVDAFAQPSSAVATLNGPPAPLGLERYSGSVSLAPNTSYFLVMSIGNGGSQVQVDTINFNGADAQPAPIYQFGTDINSDGTPDLNNQCRGTRANDYVTISWNCGQAIAPRYFPKVKLLAEEPVPPPNFSLTSNPLLVDFGTVSNGTTSATQTATLINDGNVSQALGALSVSPRFSLVTDNCSGAMLDPSPAATSTCTVGLQFTPDHGGQTTGTLIIPAVGDPRTPYGLPLVGESTDPVTVVVSVGGIITGLVAGESTVLQNNSGDDLTVSADGSFVFATPLTSGSSYAVTVLTQPGPISEACTVANGAGTVGTTDITNVAVTCSLNNFTAGGIVSGLASGQSVELLNLGGDPQVISANGSFAFSPQADGTAYAVTVGIQPAGQSCSVTNGSGTLPGGTNVTNIAVTCVDTPIQVGGLLTGLVAGESVVLQNNGADNLTLFADGSFVFPTTVVAGAAYSVTVLTQPGPVSEICTVSNGSGTATSADVTNVVVACALNTFSVGGSVTGLPSGSSVTLLNRGADGQTVNGSAAFLFSPQADGTSYDITVSSQPTGFNCTVTNGSGILPGGADVSDVQVSCTAASSQAPKPVPMLPVWMLMLLSTLIAGLGMAASNRRRRH